MKRTPFAARWLVISFVILAVLLSACERPIERDDLPDTTDAIEPTTTPIVIPTAVPVEELEQDVSDAPESGESSEPVGDAEAPAEAETSAEASEAEAPAEAAEEAEPPAETERTETSYTVQAGDTLGQIADAFDLTIEELAAANGITNIHSLDIGQVLVIPVPGSVEAEVEAPPAESEGEERTHVVLAGENLYRIGLAYGFTAEELAEYNGIVNINRVDIGQVIRIPPAQP